MEPRWYKIHDTDGILRVPTGIGYPEGSRWLVLMNGTLVLFPVSSRYRVEDWDGWEAWFSKPLHGTYRLMTPGETDISPWVRLADRKPPENRWVLVLDLDSFDLEFATADRLKDRADGKLYWYDDDEVKVIHYERRKDG